MKKLSLFLILVLVLTSCSGTTSPESNEGTQDEEDITEGGKYAFDQVYKAVYDEEVQTANYLKATTNEEFALAANLVDTLVDYDKYGIIQPALAESWSVSEDMLTWTFHIRKGVKWVDHEGKEIAEATAGDFVSAAKYLLTPANESSNANIFYGVIKNAEEYFYGEIPDFSQVGVKALDEYTLEYTLKRPIPYFESLLTDVCFMPVYGPFVEEMGDSFGTTNTTLLYNGAYILSDFEPKIQRVLNKNLEYWDADSIYVTELNYKYNKEATALAEEMFKNGEISDFVIPLANLDEWMNTPELKDQVRPDKPGTDTYFYAFNFEPKFDVEYEPENWKLAVNNGNFRKSVMFAFNRVDAMATEDPYNPEYRLINSITPPEFTYQNGVDFTETGKLAELKNGNFFNEEYANELKEKAVEELSAAGAKFPVKVLMPYNSNSTLWSNEAQVIKQQLESVLGTDYVEIVLAPHDPKGFLDSTRRTGNYSLMKCNWDPDYADPQTYTDPFKRGSDYNFPEYTTDVTADGKNIYAAYEGIVNEAKSEYINLNKRYKLFADAEAMLIDNAFVIPYGVSGGNEYVASYVNPFELPFAPIGISRNRWKGQKLLAKPMNMEEFNDTYEEWKAVRGEVLKKAAEK